MIRSKINDRYELMLTPDRVDFHTPRPGWERERLERMVDVTKTGMNVYDIGAECGDFTALYHLWVGEEGTVVPVEPQPQYWPAIRAHWEGNNLPALEWYFPGFASDVTQVKPKIVDHMAGYIIPDESGWPIASLGKIQPDFGFRHLAQQTNHTPQMTIDDMVTTSGIRPDVIVMDIEGAEYHALQGADKVLREIHPIMFVSIHPQTMLDWYGATLEQLLDFMASCGYAHAEMLGEDSEMYWFFV